MTIISSRLIFVAVSAALFAGACGGSKSAPTGPATAEATAREGGGMATGMCPMQVPGTQVSAEDTNDGAAMVFTTTGDVDELRQRVHQMAKMHDQMSADNAGPGMGTGGMGARHKHMMANVVPSNASAEDVDRGARINLTPKDPSKLSDLRAHAREHAARMASGQCPMVEAHS